MSVVLLHPGLHSQSRPFRVGFWSQRAWDWRVAFYLYLAGSSGGLLFTELVFRGLGVLDNRTTVLGGWIGLALAAMSLLVLFSHLGPGSRWRFLKVFNNPRNSWISRGAIIVTVLMALRFAVLLPSLFEGLPWDEGTVAGTVLREGVLIFAAAFTAYSGLVLSSWSSIAFWNTPLLPVLYVGYSFLGGLAALPVIALIAGGNEAVDAVGPRVWPLLMALLVGNGFALLVYIAGMAAASLPARESVRRLVLGERRWSWWIGVVGIGLVVPTILASLLFGDLVGTGTGTTSILIVTCVAVQLGGYLLRENVLGVGVYGPPV